VHTVDARTFILRQNMSVHYEAPFLYVFVGDRRAVLVDTGASADPRAFPLRDVVDGLIGGAELVVVHTHGHGDHVAGDGQFVGRPRTTVVPADLGAVTAFFGLAEWPEGSASLDLGGRTLDVIPSPGHDVGAVSFYDRERRFLLTGDTLYPGRLYVRDWLAFTATVDRLVGFTTAHPVSLVLGCHVEMTRTPGVDYKIRTTYQPDERPLEMSTGHLLALQAAVREIERRPGIHVFDDFIVYNGIPQGYFG
jgi:glyoxylase-like metal-dependent hydrolase (beta-lactamase superfamily II)